MSKEFDKIRILWIDDCESQDAVYMYPEKTLPAGEIDQYFRIVTHKDIPGPSTIRTPKDFRTCFSPFWSGSGNKDILPPEIIGMDYNLQKWMDTKVIVEKPTGKKPPHLMSQAAKNSGIVTQDTQKADTLTWQAGFEGLVLGLFLSSLMHHHPIGIVPMTNYGDMLENIPEVRALHLVSQEVLHIDYSQFGVSGEDRSWDNVLKKGVKALRARIERLYEKHQLILAPSDLMAMTNDASHSVLRIKSPYAERKLPIQGLFIDVPTEERSLAIQNWGKELMNIMRTGCDEIRRGQELAGWVWEAYNNNTLVKDRMNLSILALQEKSGKTINSVEYNRLCKKFNVVKKKAMDECIDITSGDYSDRERRWATMFVTLKLLKKLILIRKHVEKHVRKTTAMNPDIQDGPVLTADDIYLALFPAPATPLVLPWHKGVKINKASGWTRTMMRWKDRKTIANNRGDLALSVSDMLEGKGWNPKGPFGLTEPERLILYGFALEDPDLTEEEWLRHTGAKRFLCGVDRPAGGWT